MIKLKKRENERAEALLRRFNRLIQDSGLLRTVKEKRFYQKPLSKKERREQAIRKAGRRKARGIFYA